MPSVDQLIVWAVVGLLGGTIASLAVTWKRVGFGRSKNFGLGLIGALVGGLIFRIFGLFPGLDRILGLASRCRGGVRGFSYRRAVVLALDARQRLLRWFIGIGAVKCIVRWCCCVIANAAIAGWEVA